MHNSYSSLDRRRFLRGVGGFALALPWLETYATAATLNPQEKKRLACFYMPDGVPMPRVEDPAFQEWSWFPHGEGKDFQFTKCLEPLEPLRQDLTVFGGLSREALIGSRLGIGDRLKFGASVVERRTASGHSLNCQRDGPSQLEPVIQMPEAHTKQPGYSYAYFVATKNPKKCVITPRRS